MAAEHALYQRGKHHKKQTKTPIIGFVSQMELLWFSAAWAAHCIVIQGVCQSPEKAPFNSSPPSPPSSVLEWYCHPWPKLDLLPCSCPPSFSDFISGCAVFLLSEKRSGLGKAVGSRLACREGQGGEHELMKSVLSGNSSLIFFFPSPFQLSLSPLSTLVFIINQLPSTASHFLPPPLMACWILLLSPSTPPTLSVIPYIFLSQLIWWLKRA